MRKAERLAKQLTNLGVVEFRELQSILEAQGFLLGLTIVPDSWLREHGTTKEAEGTQGDGGHDKSEALRDLARSIKGVADYANICYSNDSQEHEAHYRHIEKSLLGMAEWIMKNATSL